MGDLFKKRTSTSSTERRDLTTTPVNPDWLTEGVQGAAGRVRNIGGSNPTDYVAPASDLQTRAFEAGLALQGKTNPYRAEALGALSAANGAQTAYVTPQGVDPMQTYSGETAAGGISRYMNPYMNDVVEATRADIEHAAKIADQQAKSAATSAGAWGGDGEQVLRGITNANYSRDLATTIANLRSGGFQTALQAANADANRAQEASAAGASAANQRAMQEAQFRQQAQLANQAANENVRDRYLQSANLLAGLGGNQASEDLAIVDLLAGLGGTQRGINSDFRTAPISLAATEADLLSSLPLNLFTGQREQGTVTGTGTASQGGGILGGLGSLAFGLGSLGWSPFGK